MGAPYAWDCYWPFKATRRLSNGQREDGRYTARATATLLNVDVSTIAAWCKSGRLDAIQTKPHSPWWIKLTPEIIAELRQPIRRRKPRRSAA